MKITGTTYSIGNLFKPFRKTSFFFFFVIWKL